MALSRQVLDGLLIAFLRKLRAGGGDAEELGGGIYQNASGEASASS